MDEKGPWTRAEPCRSSEGPCRRDSSSQTCCRLQAGYWPRLTKVNLFTLLSLWLELFPQEEAEENGENQTCRLGLVVVRNSKVVGLHCSGSELHAGQVAIIQHGASLSDCDLYFSRRPCATCLKMIINAGVSQISFWPGDPEVSMLSYNSTQQPHSLAVDIKEEAALDAVATEKLKSNSRAHIRVLLQPLPPGLVHYVESTSKECDFMERLKKDDPALDTDKLFNRERTRHMEDFSRHFLIQSSQQHRELLRLMGLENFCVEPFFSNLRNNMRETVEVLAAVAAGVPQCHHNFYREPASAPGAPRDDVVSQEVARHCIVQARLLAYRTEDPKVGVGAVIWAKSQQAGYSGTGSLYLVGCGYNAYPAGSEYAEYPQMDTKQENRQTRKYRFIIHAEQNALTFRTCDIKPHEATMLFVTKCPCDECIPLIRGARITHIYTTDQDRDKDKGDISYLQFGSLKNINKFIWQKTPSSLSQLTNGLIGKHNREQEQSHTRKKLRTSSEDLPVVS
ncbi:cytidine and dCMP deaminase domain-containing protein 1 isoform 1-T3 [Synchiropus picturatus]